MLPFDFFFVTPVYVEGNLIAESSKLPMWVLIIQMTQEVCVGMGSRTHTSLLVFACTTRAHTDVTGAGIRARPHTEIKVNCKRSRKTCHALRFSLSLPSFSGLPPLLSLLSLCMGSGDVSFLHIKYNAVDALTGQACLSLGRRPYPVQLCQSLGECGGELEAGRVRLEEKESGMCEVRQKD